MIGSLVCCARTAIGHVAVAPPINEMKSRRLIASPEAYEHWFKLARIADQCPLWVKSGRHALKFRCPLCPQSGHGQTPMQCLLWAKIGLMRRSKDAGSFDQLVGKR
jgi:hypothetical protein